MVVFLWAGNTFVQIPAFPAKIGAPVRITLFYLQDMIDRYRMVKAAVGVVGAAENVVPLIVVNQVCFCREIIFNQTEKIPVHVDPLSAIIARNNPKVHDIQVLRVIMVVLTPYMPGSQWFI